MMKGPKKGLKFGAKKNNLDDFIESEFTKINKNQAPQAEDGEFGSGNDDGSNQYGGAPGGGFNSGQNSNYERSPNVGYSGAVPSSGITSSSGAKKNPLAFKPFDVKKKLGAASGSKPLFGSVQNNNNQLNIDESGAIEDSSSGNDRGYTPSSNLKNLGAIKQQIDIQGGSNNTQSNTSILSKPQLNSGGKATLPSSVVKTYKIKPRQKFMMDEPDVKASGLNYAKLNVEEDVVESLKDDDYNRQMNRPGQMKLGGLPPTSLGTKPKIIPSTNTKQLGPQFMRDKLKNQDNSRTEKRPPSAQKDIKQKSNQGTDDDDYSDGGFEDNADDGKDEDQLEKLRKAMDRENKRAIKHIEQKPQLLQQNPGGNQGGPKAPSGNNAMQNLDSFAKNRGLIVGEKVDHLAANQQLIRAEELRELVGLGQEEFFNMFEMVPQTPQDVYFSKLTTGVIKTSCISTADENIERDIQTEDLGEESKFNQAPEDMMTNYNKNKTTYQRRKKKENEALQLEKFLQRAGPVMETVLDENEWLSFLGNREQASKRNAVELKQNLKFPMELLMLFIQNFKEPQIQKISCVHMFESSPQAKCAVSYVIKLNNGDMVYLTIVYSVLANTAIRILRSESEVTQMCTPGDDSILILGTVHGSLLLYDLKEFDLSNNARSNELNFDALMSLKEEDPDSQSEFDEHQNKMQQLRNRYNIQWPTFSTDGLPNYMHFAPVKRLLFVSKFGGGSAQIGVIDELLTLSTWSLIETQSAVLGDRAFNEFDLNMSMGGRFKLLENYSENLMIMPEVMGHHGNIHDVSQSLELEFDNTDPNTFYFSVIEGLFKFNRRQSPIPTRLDTEGLGAPTALSMSDKGYLLVGFTCGSIGMYHENYTSPITIWYHACNQAITQIKWCYLYFQDDQAGLSASPEKRPKQQADGVSELSNVKFATRLCEFFAIDQAEDFYIWNMQKSLNKSAHVIHFNEKHSSQTSQKIFRISMTCPDQSFFTAFALSDFSVNMYLMNFKKGSQITKEKLTLENKKSYKIISTLPLNAQSTTLISQQQ